MDRPGPDAVRSVAAVLALGPRLLELIVVAASRVELPGDPRVRLLVVEERNPALRRNKAAAEARGEYLAFVDDDAFAREDWLEKAAGFLDDNPGVLAVGGPDPAPADSTFAEWHLPRDFAARRRARQHGRAPRGVRRGGRIRSGDRLHRRGHGARGGADGPRTRRLSRRCGRLPPPASVSLRLRAPAMALPGEDGKVAGLRGEALPEPEDHRLPPVRPRLRSGGASLAESRRVDARGVCGDYLHAGQRGDAAAPHCLAPRPVRGGGLRPPRNGRRPLPRVGSRCHEWNTFARPPVHSANTR